MWLKMGCCWEVVDSGDTGLVLFGKVEDGATEPVAGIVVPCVADGGGGADDNPARWSWLAAFAGALNVVMLEGVVIDLMGFGEPVSTICRPGCSSI